MEVETTRHTCAQLIICVKNLQYKVPTLKQSDGKTFALAQALLACVETTVYHTLHDLQLKKVLAGSEEPRPPYTIADSIFPAFSFAFAFACACAFAFVSFEQENPHSHPWK